MKKLILPILAVLVFLALAWIIASGFSMRTDVFLKSYSVSDGKDEITLQVGIAGSAGYVRDFLNDTQRTDRMELQFYSTFGGPNSSIGARDIFAIPLNPDCREIYFYQNDGFVLVLKKDPASGSWEKCSSTG